MIRTYRSQLLNELLSEATGYEVEAVIIERHCAAGERWWIFTRKPPHDSFWYQFRKLFDPHDNESKLLRGALEWGPCPEFRSIDKLLRWISNCTRDPRYMWVADEMEESSSGRG